MNPSSTVFAVNFLTKMKYEKLFKTYKFFFSFVPLQAILFVKSSYTEHTAMYRSLLNSFSKNAALI